MGRDRARVLSAAPRIAFRPHARQHFGRIGYLDRVFQADATPARGNWRLPDLAILDLTVRRTDSTAESDRWDHLLAAFADHRIIGFRVEAGNQSVTFDAAALCWNLQPAKPRSLIVLTVKVIGRVRIRPR